MATCNDENDDLMTAMVLATLVKKANAEVKVAINKPITITNNIKTVKGLKRQRDSSSPMDEDGEDSVSEGSNRENGRSNKVPLTRRERKNNREKQRRLEVNIMFDRLTTILGIPNNLKVDKVAVLSGAIELITELTNEVQRCGGTVPKVLDENLGTASSSSAKERT